MPPPQAQLEDDFKHSALASQHVLSLGSPPIPPLNDQTNAQGHVAAKSSQQSTGLAEGNKEPHVEEIVGSRNVNATVHAGLDPMCA